MAKTKADKAADTDVQQNDQFVCPECGRTFTRAAALGAHRNRAHGIAGSSRSATASKGGRRQTTRRSGRHSATQTTAAGSTQAGRTSRQARSRRAQSGPADIRNTLLKAAFPNGVPPREDVIRDLAAWLDEGERLAKLN
jgi:uncharacterized C2H2 Zn-finger protein